MNEYLKEDFEDFYGGGDDQALSAAVQFLVSLRESIDGRQALAIVDLSMIPNEAEEHQFTRQIFVDKLKEATGLMFLSEETADLPGKCYVTLGSLSGIGFDSEGEIDVAFLSLEGHSDGATLTIEVAAAPNLEDLKRFEKDDGWRGPSSVGFEA